MLGGLALRKDTMMTLLLLPSQCHTKFNGEHMKLIIAFIWTYIPWCELNSGEAYAGISLGMRPANDECRYSVMRSLIGWAHN